jgi:hypothetical protein
VLGAGNCNDLDLRLLLGAHREVHLVDLDAGALTRGIDRQGLSGHPRLWTYGDIDVTSMLDTFSTWSPRTQIRPENIAACIEDPVRLVCPSLPGPFDSVASTCLLSQLIGVLVATLGEGHPRFGDFVQAVRAGHLRLLAHLTAPRGTTALVTDVVSAETFPALRSIPEASLPGVLVPLARERNYFHGVNPAVLWSMVARDPVLASMLVGPEASPPWQWDLGPRLYLVWALRWRRRLIFNDQPSAASYR